MRGCIILGSTCPKGKEGVSEDLAAVGFIVYLFNRNVLDLCMKS